MKRKARHTVSFTIYELDVLCNQVCHALLGPKLEKAREKIIRKMKGK